MSHSQFRSKKLILRHAWLNLWDKHMTTGRINQVTTRRWSVNCSTPRCCTRHQNTWWKLQQQVVPYRLINNHESHHQYTVHQMNHVIVAALFYFAASLEALSQWTPIRKIQPTEWDSTEANSEWERTVYSNAFSEQASRNYPTTKFKAK